MSRSDAMTDMMARRERGDLTAPDVQREFVELIVDYSRARPGVAALWCLGIGFILGWKLKPW